MNIKQKLGTGIAIIGLLAGASYTVKNCSEAAKVSKALVSYVDRDGSGFYSPSELAHFHEVTDTVTILPTPRERLEAVAGSSNPEDSVKVGDWYEDPLQQICAEERKAFLRAYEGSQ